MSFGEPHPFPGKRITYQNVRVGTTMLGRVIVQKLMSEGQGCNFLRTCDHVYLFILDFYCILNFCN